MSERPIKLFISHSSKDKVPFVKQLYEALKAKVQFEVWYDTDSLRLGDSLTFTIPKELSSSDYAIAILSRTYFDSKWCRLEFASMITLETNEKKILLPILHNVSLEEAVAFNPILGDRLAFRSDMSIDKLILAIETATWSAGKAREVGDPLRKEFSELADALADHEATERLSHSDHGMMLVRAEASRLLELFVKRLEQVNSSMQITVKRTQQLGNSFASPFTDAVLLSGQFRLSLQFGFMTTYTNDTSHAKIVVELFHYPHAVPTKLAEFKPESLSQMEFTPRFTVHENVQWKDSADASIHTSEVVAERALTLFKEEIKSRLKDA